MPRTGGGGPSASARRGVQERHDGIPARVQHGERTVPATRAQRHHIAPISQLPDGAFVVRGGEPWLVRGAQILRWTPGGYAERRRRPRDRAATVITPPSLVALLRAGWDPLVPFLHPSAG